MKKLLYTLGDVVHALQHERGCTSIFLYSEGKLFSDRMNEQFSNSDEIIKTFKKEVESWKKKKKLQDYQLQKIESLLKLCLELPEWRIKVIEKNISAADCISHYSHHVIGPILQFMIEFALQSEGSNSVHVSAYNAFLQWKERVGLERAIGARGFVGYSFHNKEFVERLSFLLSEQSNYKNTYMALASDEQKKIIESQLKKSDAKKLHKLHDELKKSPDSGILYDMTPGDWFDLLSSKMNALHAAEKELVDGLSDEHEEEAEADIVEGESQDNIFGKYEELVNSLQLFSGISKKSLESLLRHNQIRSFEKGKLLFLEGEPANRLYIILKGWIKVFKGTVAGEETILQMLSAGDTIMESAVFLNTNFPVSCQVVEDATLLSIPAPVLREQIKNNNELAVNLLSTMSHRSQVMIRQIESARLKSVDERIGWFLLKLLLEQGRLSRCVELPYDKSLIASYLDMKRETFSRALKRMKSKGFKIENDTVVIPKLDSLCDFCDNEISGHCKLHGTSDCSNPQEETLRSAS